MQILRFKPNQILDVHFEVKLKQTIETYVDAQTL